MSKIEGYKPIKFDQLLALKFCSLPPEVSTEFFLQRRQRPNGEDIRKTIEKQLRLNTNINTNPAVNSPPCSLHPDVVMVCVARLSSARLTAANSFSTGRLFYTDSMPAGFGNQRQQTDTTR